MNTARGPVGDGQHPSTRGPGVFPSDAAATNPTTSPTYSAAASATYSAAATVTYSAAGATGPATDDDTVHDSGDERRSAGNWQDDSSL